MFNKDFFQEHQKALLWVANNRLFSWLLGLNRLPKPIGQHKWTKITPNSLHYLRDDGQYEMVAFTRSRFAEALAFNLSPFMASSDFRLMTQMFSPMKYAGLFAMFMAVRKGWPLMMMGITESYYVGSGDGYVGKADSSNWDTTHDASSGGSSDYTGTSFVVYSQLNTSTFFLIRGFCPVDTSGLPDTATVSAGVLSLFLNQAGAQKMNLCSTTQASTSSLSNSDFSKVGDVKKSDEVLCTGSAGDKKDFTLNDLTLISLTGFTKLGIRTRKDFEDIAPSGNTGEDVQVGWRSSEYTGTTYDPYLTVTYTSGSTAKLPAMMAVL